MIKHKVIRLMVGALMVTTVGCEALAPKIENIPEGYELVADEDLEKHGYMKVDDIEVVRIHEGTFYAANIEGPSDGYDVIGLVEIDGTEYNVDLGSIREMYEVSIGDEFSAFVRIGTLDDGNQTPSSGRIMLNWGTEEPEVEAKESDKFDISLDYISSLSSFGCATCNYGSRGDDHDTVIVDQDGDIRLAVCTDKES